MSIKVGDIVEVKNSEGMNPLIFKVDEIKDSPSGKMVSGEYGDFAINLVTKLKTETKPLKDCSLIETIERLAATNYSYAEMAIYVGMKKSAFIKEATKVDSNIWIAIQKGRLETEFEINDTLAQNAKTGNITAAQIYAKNSETKHVENLKQQIFYGE